MHQKHSRTSLRRCRLWPDDIHRDARADVRVLDVGIVDQGMRGTCADNTGAHSIAVSRYRIRVFEIYHSAYRLTVWSKRHCPSGS